MNLHGMAARYVGSVNPLVEGQVFINTGWTGELNTKRVPTYADPITKLMQIQALETSDLEHNDALNKSGSTHKIYISGDLQGVMRANKSGGDKITMTTGTLAGFSFLVTSVLEGWPDWTCVSVTLQNKT